MSEDTSSYDQDLQDLKQQYKNYNAQDPELCRTLRMYGLGEVMIVKTIDTFSIKHTRQFVLKENPYNLMKVEGIGFLKADNVARQMGIQSEDPRRQKALIQSVLENSKNFGNVYLHTTVLEKECKKQNVHKFSDMLTEMIKSGDLILDGNRIYLKYLYRCETEVAKMVRYLCGLDTEPFVPTFSGAFDKTELPAQVEQDLNNIKSAIETLENNVEEKVETIAAENLKKKMKESTMELDLNLIHRLFHEKENDDDIPF